MSSSGKAGGRTAEGRWLRLAYTQLFRLLSPFMLLRLWWRGRAQPAYRSRWRERFGFVNRPPMLLGDTVVWVHAVSVGETQAAEVLVRTLLADDASLAIVMTTTTPTGAAQVRKLFDAYLVKDGQPGRLFHSYAPFDLPGSIRRFIKETQPKALLVMETEVWPNWLAICRACDVPSYLINARLSARSARGYERVRGLAAPAFQTFTHICAQAQADADRLVALGVRADSLSVTGSIKFDQSITLDDEHLRGLVAEEIATERFVWVAASTHEGEEQVVIEAHAGLLKTHPDALLILVPRHPDRFDRVDDLLERSGLRYIRRSLLPAQRGAVKSVDVLLVDSMGELLYFYEAGHLAFVGGSLVDNGGHNPLEPAALGKAVMMGESQFNFADICTQLSGARALITVSSKTLQTAIESYAQNPERARLTGEKGQAFVERNRGAVKRVYERILPGLRSSSQATAS